MNLQDIVKILRKRIFLIICLITVFTGIAAIISYFFLTPVYQAQTQILVNQKEHTNNNYVLPEQVETDLQLINTYNVIIKSPAILNKVIKKLDLKVTSEKLTKQITVSNESNSKVVNIRVRNTDPAKAVEISNTIAEVFKKEIPVLMNVDNINILSPAKLTKNPIPVKPNQLMNIVIAAFIGLLIGGGLAFLLEFYDTTIKSEMDLESLGLPVMGVVSSINQEKDFR